MEFGFLPKWTVWLACQKLATGMPLEWRCRTSKGISTVLPVENKIAIFVRPEALSWILRNTWEREDTFHGKMEDLRVGYRLTKGASLSIIRATQQSNGLTIEVASIWQLEAFQYNLCISDSFTNLFTYGTVSLKCLLSIYGVPHTYEVLRIQG